MVRKLIIACAVMGLSLGVVQAQDDMMGDEPPMHPEVILLGPPEGFEPPEDMPPPPMDDPEAAKEMMLETFFNFMDADGSGAVDLDEFHEWVIDFHMPPPPDDMGDDGMGPPPDDMGDDEGMMDGFLHAGEGDLADLNLAPECSDDLHDSEQGPQAEGIPCGDMEGNLIFRTICAMPGYERVAISLPDGRGAGCFDIEALTGVIGFEIVNGDGDLVWEMEMGKESYRDLKLQGPGVFEVKSTGGSPDGALTIKFVDVHTGM
ncbi:MAG: hypothetical protein VCF24_09710 [Candidatus Latescibacterota bacterium]